MLARRTGTLGATALTLIAMACGDSTQTPSEPTPPGVASLIVAIPPTNAIRSRQSSFPWAANFTVNLLEEAGIGVNVHEIKVELANDVIYDMTDIQLAAGGTLVPGKGILAVPLTIAFENPQIVAQVVVRATDDGGTPIQAAGRLVVIAAQRP